VTGYGDDARLSVEMIATAALFYIFVGWLSMAQSFLHL